MRLRLDQLETFYWIVRLGSFHAAARHLHLTQPTISARIHELEATLGFTLFDRSNRRTRMTPAAAGVLQQAEQIIRVVEQIEHAARLHAPLRGLLRLGAIEAVALTCLPELVAQLNTRYPQLRLELTMEMGAVLNRRMREGELDLAFVTDASRDAPAVVEPIGNIRQVWLASPGLALPEKELAPADLVGKRIVTGAEPSTLHSLVVGWFRQAGYDAPKVSTCNSLTLMGRIAAAGNGIALLPPSILRPQIDAGQLRVLPTHPPIQPPTLFVAYANEKVRHALRAVVRMAREIMEASELFT